MEQHTIRNKGLLNLPGITHETKSLAEKLSLADAEEHHCYFHRAGFHNHLCHQLLAAYDMGASTGVIRKIYDMMASYQRPIYPSEGDANIIVTRDNWTKYLGEQEAYGAYFKFFRDEIKQLGPSVVLESYVFLPKANDEGRNMLDRLHADVLHPFIQVGYAAEFGSDILMATGLAQTAIHETKLSGIFPYSLAWGLDNVSPPAPAPSTGRGRQPSTGPSLLSILREICDSSTLAPPLPYNANFGIYKELQESKEEKTSEIINIVQRYTLSISNDASDEELEFRIEELVWAATLLLFATGRQGREPRLDFFLMHLVTSSLFFEPIFRVLKTTRAKVALIRHYVLAGLVPVMLSRGRPLIRANLVQDWTDKPRPPSWDQMLGVKEVKNSDADDTKKDENSKTLSSLVQEASHDPEHLIKMLQTTILKGEKGVGDINKDEDYNPWPLLIQGALHHPDFHLAKVMRTLIFASRKYGSTGPGEAIGAFRRGTDQEIFEGMSQLDGTFFVRAAGVLMDFMKWTLNPGDVANEPQWDRSALGYDEAWESQN